MRRAAASATCSLLAVLLLAGSASAVTLQARIVGGVDAGATDVPWQVLVLPGGYLCGGSVLDALHVATAAHCVLDDTGTPFAPADVDVFAGITDVAARYDGQHPAVERIDVDPGYDTSTYQDDLAVLTLAPPGFDLSGSTPQPIALPDPGFSPAATDDLVVSGWGTTAARSPYDNTTNTDPISSILQKATVRLSTECAGAYGWRYDPAKQLCAGEAGTDACQGDSGGPLAMNLHGTWTLVGTVSSGAGCAWDQFPGLYTRMSATSVRGFVAQILGEPVTTTPTPTVSSNAVATSTSSASAPAQDPTPAPTTTTAPPPSEPAATTATATAPAADLAAPTSRITRVRCSQRRRTCILDVRVSDAAPSDGIAHVDARARSSIRSWCRRHGRRVRCTRTATRRLHVARVGTTSYRVTTPRLARGRQRFAVVAVDAAGHRQQRAAVRSATLR